MSVLTPSLLSPPVPPSLPLCTLHYTAKENLEIKKARNRYRKKDLKRSEEIGD